MVTNSNALDSSGLLQGGKAFAEGMLKQQQMAIEQAQMEAKNQLDYAQLARQDAQLKMQQSDMQFQHSATAFQQSLQQQKFLQDNVNFTKTYALQQAQLGLQKQELDAKVAMQQGQLGLQGQQLGLEVAKTGIQQEQFQQAQGAQQNQFAATYGLQQRDAAYKEAMMKFQMSPTNPENIARMVGIAKDIKALNTPLSEQGKIQADVATGVIPQSVADAALLKSVGGKIPTGYRYSDPSNPNSPLEPIPGGPGQRQSPQNAASNAALTEAARDLTNAKAMLYDAEGGINRKVLANVGVLNPEARLFQQTVQRSIMSKLRLESGAAISDEELKRYNNMFTPNMWDSKAAIDSKLESLGNFLQSTKKSQGDYNPVEESKGGISDSDLAFTAKQNNMTIAQVKSELKKRGKL